jgi:Fe-S-cluster containining protein
MLDSYQNDIKWVESNQKKVKKTIDSLKKNRNTDLIINNLHDEVFEDVDCLKCANCCRTTGPLLTGKDIERLSKHLKMTESNFTTNYLRIDEDGDFVFKTMPCPFLDTDNYCSVYANRPKACRAFPHTDASGQINILHLTRKNARICPAVSQIFQRLQATK